ncbi:hypothetical protein A155_00904 [Escherichia coli KTE197]|nr:hypothetical protein A155_00904 [Escherichia coli KTE197]
MNVLRHVNAINMGVCILIWVIGCANAKVLKRCILPAPDGGVEKLSKPNLHGVIKKVGNDSNLLIVFYVQIMPDDFVMQLHRF